MRDFTESLRAALNEWGKRYDHMKWERDQAIEDRDAWRDIAKRRGTMIDNLALGLPLDQNLRLAKQVSEYRYGPKK